MSLVANSSVWELFWTKCKILAYSLSGRLLIHLWSHLPHALVVSSPPPNTTIPALWPLSYWGVIYITDCASPPGITSIVFLFHPSLSWLLCSSLEWHHSCLGFPSPKKFQADLSLSSPPPSPLSLSFSDGLSQGQEFRVVCLPQNRAEDIWWTAVGCDCGLHCAPTGSVGGDLLTLVAAYELLWSRNVSEVHSSISLLLQNLADYSD